MAKRSSSVFVCQECGAQSPRWFGLCTECGKAGTAVEEREATAEGDAAAAGTHRYALASTRSTARKYADVTLTDQPRLSTSIDEFDRAARRALHRGEVVCAGRLERR